MLTWLLWLKTSGQPPAPTSAVNFLKFPREACEVRSPPPSRQCCRLTLPCVGLITVAALGSEGKWPCYTWKTVFQSIPPFPGPSFVQSFCPPFCNILRTLARVIEMAHLCFCCFLPLMPMCGCHFFCSYHRPLQKEASLPTADSSFDLQTQT